MSLFLDIAANNCRGHLPDFLYCVGIALENVAVIVDELNIELLQEEYERAGLDQLNAIFGEEEPLSDVMDIVVQTHSGMSAYDCAVRIATGVRHFLNYKIVLHIIKRVLFMKELMMSTHRK